MNAREVTGVMGEPVSIPKVPLHVNVHLVAHITVHWTAVKVFVDNPARKIAEKAMWRSVFLTIWDCILNAASTKTPSSSVTF